MDGQVYHYEELRGSAGRRAFFRAERHEAEELFPSPAPTVKIGVNNVWSLSNISLRGIAIASHHIEDAGVGIGDSFPVSIAQGGIALFEGTGTVRRVERMGSGSKIALHFQDDFIDISALRRKDAQARMRTTFAALVPARQDAVPDAYRVLCSDVLTLLRGYRSFLEQRSDLQAEVGGSDGGGALELCVEQIMPQWRALWQRGNELTAEAAGDPEALRSIKTMTELILTHELCHAPIWQRAFGKPLGYAGDHVLTNTVFRGRREGATPYAQLLQRLGLDALDFIRTRAAGISDRIVGLANTRGADAPLRCLSIGSGSAPEIARILERTSRGRAPVHLTLVDQEDAALQNAYEISAPAVRMHHAGATFSGKTLPLAAMMQGGLPEAVPHPQDAVYSLGLFDHLDDKRARSLAMTLFKHVKPGGFLILGNMNKSAQSALWPMECLMDWPMHYRTESDMLGWAEGMMKQAAWTECDSTGHARLLFVHKSG